MQGRWTNGLLAMHGGEPTQTKETFSGLFLWCQRESEIAVGCNNRSSVVRKEPWESHAIGTKKRPFRVSFCGANGNRKLQLAAIIVRA